MGKKRDKRDAAAGGKSSPRPSRSRSKTTAAPRASVRRGFRSNIEGISRVKQTCWGNDQPALVSLAGSSHSLENELTSDSELTTPPVSGEETDSELESTTTSKNFSKRNAKTKLLSDVKQKLESATSTETSFKKRYILFLGNLPRTVSRDDVINHFSKRGVPIAELRLLTDKESGQSKGCAFAEFSSTKAMQNALKFHRSKLQGRTINVEMTCGGGGKGKERLKKIRERNRTLRRTTTVQSGKVIKYKNRI